MRHSSLAIAAALALAATVGHAETNADLKVGVTSAVAPQTYGTLRAAPTRTLSSGAPVHFGEVLETGPQGRAQFMLNDRSAFTLGPSARMVIDEFVYDPNESTGSMAVSLGEGVLRFVGGALSKQRGRVAINTPTTTIGVRGGIVTVRVVPGTGETFVTLGFGEADISTRLGEVVRIVQPGYGLSVGSDGTAGPPTPTQVPTAAGLNRALQGEIGNAEPGAPPASRIRSAFGASGMARAADAASSASAGAGGARGTPAGTPADVTAATVQSAKDPLRGLTVIDPPANTIPR
ncbi:MAG: FecR domain-containing protein [Alphaproteobacteria bacterium]|nr:FecR domain-containing protein [Alphaproteobacteria bacterium]MDX5369063.1 FecR domain-containing protein [Alphaproteobacteria bacterium]MDX5463767.1 FecR domain-containing protein [Alphaproteobacteria bacterium]